jgi:hypothetical protein
MQNVHLTHTVARSLPLASPTGLTPVCPASWMRWTGAQLTWWCTWGTWRTLMAGTR